MMRVHRQAVGHTVGNRILVAESTQVMNLAPSPQTLQELAPIGGDHFSRMERLPPAVQMLNQARGTNAC
uniref:Uncharacterized protein n=1 Tax=Physcomitrium patens TaxID=3218 RepID=A0A2K1J7Z8_PHYPA|nr:hypothetical protein PHYPA_020761 [Physcomitrium patens]